MPQQDLRITYHHQEFEWDLQCSRGNIEKYLVGFDEAITIFVDPNRHTLKTEYKDDALFCVVGTSQQIAKLVVVHCERKQDKVIRIIWARSPTRWEKDEYLKNIGLST